MAAFTLEHTLLGGLAATAVVAGLACIFAMFRHAPTLVLPPQRCRAVPWGAGLCLMVFVLFTFPQPYVARFVIKEMPENADQSNVILATLIGSLLTLPFQVVAFRALVSHLARTFIPLGTGSLIAVCRDAGIGCATWLAATPLALGIQVIVRMIAHSLTSQPLHENKLIEILRLQRHESGLWLLITLEAVLLAPIREELLFRGCIQNWLTRRPWGGDLAVALSVIAPSVLFSGGMSLAKTFSCCAFVGISAAVLWMCGTGLRNWSGRWPWLFPRLAHGSVDSQAAFRAVVGTSLLFAVFHAPSWPDPIPLFAFGLVLGWLAWRTQGVVAPMVCHSMFNATSLVVLRLIPNSGV